MYAVIVLWVLTMVVLLWIASRYAGGSSGGLLAFLVDETHRFSLSRFQVFAWSVVLIGLIIALAAYRLWAIQGASALLLDIPDQMLGVMGIALGSGAVAKGVDRRIAPPAHNPGSPATPAAPPSFVPTLSQLWTERTTLPTPSASIDVSRFQNAVLTGFLLVAYVFMVVFWLRGNDVGLPNTPLTLPHFSGGLVSLLAVSHAGYLAGKLPKA